MVPKLKYIDRNINNWNGETEEVQLKLGEIEKVW